MPFSYFKAVPSGISCCANIPTLFPASKRACKLASGFCCSSRLFFNSHKDLWHCRPRVNCDFERKIALGVCMPPIIFEKVDECNTELSKDELLYYPSGPFFIFLGEAAFVPFQSVLPGRPSWVLEALRTSSAIRWVKYPAGDIPQPGNEYTSSQEF